jgi:hypothetical protein
MAEAVVVVGVVVVGGGVVGVVVVVVVAVGCVETSTILNGYCPAVTVMMDSDGVQK